MQIIVPTTAGMVAMATNAASTFQAFNRDVEICKLNTGFEMLDRSYNPFASAGFVAVCLRKIEAVHARLQYGEAVLLVDADIVVRRDPIPYLEQIDADLIIQDDSCLLHRMGDLCAGFFLARPTKPMFTLLERSMALMKDGIGDDQDALNACIHEIRGLTVHRLDQQLFPNGRIWHDYRPKDAYIVHANWVVGYNKKVNVLKRTGLYGGGSIGLVRLIYRRLWITIGEAGFLFRRSRTRVKATPILYETLLPWINIFRQTRRIIRSQTRKT